MANEDVTFSQCDFLSTSFAAFEDMRKREYLCDVTIKVQNQSFSAHRVILIAGIPCFDLVFRGLETADKEFAVGENLDPKALESLIEFAYTGKVTISSENVLSLLGAAQFLQLSQVQNACLAFLSKKLNSDNAGKIGTFACALNNPEAIQFSNVYIRENFEEFSKLEEFLSLPFACFKEIISEDDLNISCEETVFEAIMRWVKVSPSDRQGMLPDLLGESRLTYLSIEYLMEQVESEELIMSSKECRDLVKEVKYYHMMPERAPAVSNLKTHPRNYLKKDFYAFCVCSACGSSVHRYDTNEAKWQVLSSTEMTYRANTSSNWNNTVAVNGKIYRFFEWNGIQTFSVETLEWDFLKVNHEARGGAAFVPYGNVIYCFNSSSVSTGMLLCFDIQQNTVIKREFMPRKRTYAAGAALGNSIYITGGGSNHVGKYTPSTGLWNRVAPMLITRSHHCCATVNGKIYVCGNNDADATRAEVYDPFTNKWSFLPFVDSKFSYISLVSDHDKMYAFTEKNGEIYDARTRQWKSLKVPGCLKSIVSLPTTTNKN